MFSYVNKKIKCVIVNYVSKQKDYSILHKGHTCLLKRNEFKVYRSTKVNKAQFEIFFRKYANNHKIKPAKNRGT